MAARRAKSRDGRRLRRNPRGEGALGSSRPAGVQPGDEVQASVRTSSSTTVTQVAHRTLYGAAVMRAAPTSEEIEALPAQAGTPEGQDGTARRSGGHHS